MPTAGLPRLCEGVSEQRPTRVDQSLDPGPLTAPVIVGPHVRGGARKDAGRRACPHHGEQRRGRDLPPVRGSGQPHGPPLPRARATASRPRRVLHREQPSHARVRGRGRALGPLLHVHQLLPVARRGGVHHQRQRVADRRDVGREARDRDAAARAVPQRRTLAHGRCRQRRCSVRESERGDGRVPGRTDRRRAARRGDALLVGHDRAAEGHPAPAARGAAGGGAGRDGVRAGHVPVPRGHDATSRRRRCTTRRRRRASRPRCDSAARR